MGVWVNGCRYLGNSNGQQPSRKGAVGNAKVLVKIGKMQEIRIALLIKRTIGNCKLKIELVHAHVTRVTFGQVKVRI